jgi:hypothetical protein
MRGAWYGSAEQRKALRDARAYASRVLGNRREPGDDSVFPNKMRRTHRRGPTHWLAFAMGLVWGFAAGGLCGALLW